MHWASSERCPQAEATPWALPSYQQAAEEAGRRVMPLCEAKAKTELSSHRILVLLFLG